MNTPCQWKACSYPGWICIWCSLCFSCRCSSFCGYMGRSWIWIGGKDSKTSGADRHGHRKSSHLCAWQGRRRRGDCRQEVFRIFCIAFVQWNDSFSLVDIFYQVVELGHIIGFVTQEGTLQKRDGMVGGGQYFPRNGTIRHIGGGSQFIKGQTGNTVHQHMVFVEAPQNFV